MTSTRSFDAVAGWQAAAELQPLVRNWWMMGGRGVLAVLFGAAIALWRIPVIVFGIVMLFASLRFRLAALAGRPQRVRF